MFRRPNSRLPVRRGLEIISGKSCFASPLKILSPATHMDCSGENIWASQTGFAIEAAHFSRASSSSPVALRPSAAPSGILALQPLTLPDLPGAFPLLPRNLPNQPGDLPPRPGTSPEPSGILPNRPGSPPVHPGRLADLPQNLPANPLNHLFISHLHRKQPSFPTLNSKLGTQN